MKFGKYTTKDIEKLTEKLYEDYEENGVRKTTFDFTQTSICNVKITENQIVVSGETLINGHEYQPVKSVFRRADDEDLFELALLTYLLYERFANGTVDDLLK